MEAILTGARPVHDDDFGELEMEHDYADDNGCPNCGGEGFYADCFEEYACIDPEGGCDLCMRRCDWCNQKKTPGG